MASSASQSRIVGPRRRRFGETIHSGAGGGQQKEDESNEAEGNGPLFASGATANFRAERLYYPGIRSNIMGVAKLTNQNTVVPESKYARIERERRYLLNDLPEGLTRTDPHRQITDNYITGTRLRIRKVRDPKTNKWIVKFTQKFAPEPENLSRTIITNIY